MQLFNALRSKARKNSNKRTPTNQTSLSNTSTGSGDKKKPHFGSIFSRSPSTRPPILPTTSPFQSHNPFLDPELPPAYSAIPPLTQPLPIPQPSSLPTPSTSSSTGDTDFSFLSTFDTLFLIDDSGSMAGRSWRETALALQAITPICTQHDADGIDIHFLNAPDSAEYTHITSPAAVERIFKSVHPRGGTPTGSRLHAILKPYLKNLEARGEEGVKPLNIIVVTDGQATDDVESVILSAARRLDRMDAPAWQVGVQFFQVGEDAEAKKMLVELDDHLGKKVKGGVRDMVDTFPWNGTSGSKGLNGKGILKVVLGAVVRRHDDAEVSSSKYRD